MPGFEFNYAIEDFVGSGGLVDPLFGGQPFDAEFLGVGVDGNTLRVAIVSGQETGNGFSNYSPGDLYVRTETGAVYGQDLQSCSLGPHELRHDSRWNRWKNCHQRRPG
jgi:hypothetical protein